MSLFSKIPFSGTAKRRNLEPNPIGAVDTSGWYTSAPSGGAATLSRMGGGSSGFSARVVSTISTAGGTQHNLETRVAVAAGQAYTFKRTVWFSAGSTTQGIIQWLSSDGSTTLGTVTNDLGSIPSSAFRRVTIGENLTAPAGAATARVIVRRIYTAPIAVGEIQYGTGAQTELASTFGDYFDGSTVFAGPQRSEWAGTAHSSESILYAPTSSESTAPLMVVAPFVGERQPDTAVHKALHASVELVTWRSAGYLRGEYKLLYATRSAALAGEALFATHPGRFAWDGDDIAAYAVTFERDTERGVIVQMEDDLVAASPNEYIWSLTVPWKAS